MSLRHHHWLFLAPILLAGCGGDPNQLDRDEAKTLVQAKINERLPDEGCYALRSFGWQAGVVQGYWTESWVTAVGQPFIADVNKQRVCLKERTAQTLEITGITDRDGTNQKTIRFRLSNDPVPDPMRRFIVSGYEGITFARRYDDGWRIEEGVHYQPVDTPLTLTNAQTQAADADLAKETARREEAERFDANRQAQLNALIEESRKPKQPMQTFHCDTMIGDRRNTIDLSVNDVQAIKVGKTFDTIGKGGVTGTSSFPYGHVPSLKIEGGWLMFEQPNAGGGTHFMYFYPSQCPNFTQVESTIRKFHENWWKSYDQVGVQQ